MNEEDSVSHKFRPEATNDGHYFADCSCGWAGGVHASRSVAREAWVAHRDGGPRVPPVPTRFLFGPRAHGQGAS